MEKEAIHLETLAIAQAVRNSGGKVIVQVEKVVEGGVLHPKSVILTNILVDIVVVAKKKHHQQTFSDDYNPTYTGETKEILGQTTILQ